MAVLDTGSGRQFGHRADERFALCSTFKLLMAAAVLHRVDRGDEKLARMVSYGASDLLHHSPVTAAHVRDGALAVGSLLEAVVTQSDNGAANLLLATLGGPPGVTRYAREIGDFVTRLDRREPALNDVPPGDMRDTTTPAAMLEDLRNLFLTPVLSAPSRAKLLGWAKACATGLNRLRAGFPSRWVVGDKTGTGFKTETNDIAIAWPPGRAPIIVTAYYTGATVDAAARDAVLADVARIVAKRWGEGGVQAPPSLTFPRSGCPG